MPWFNYLVKGENFHPPFLQDNAAIYGFFTSHNVKAATLQQAKIKIRAALEKEFGHLYSKHPQSPSKISFDETFELPRKPKNFVNKGASWFKMED